MKIVWFSEIKWTYLKTRKQQIIERFPSDWEILFIEPYVFGKKNNFLPIKEKRVTRATIPIFKGTPYNWLNNFQQFPPVHFVVLKIISLWVYLVCRITKFNDDDRVVASSNIFYADIAQKMKKKLLYYDCNDYPLGFSGILPFTEKYFKKMIVNSDVITTVSLKLKNEINQYRNKDVYVVGNGVDFDAFNQSENTLIPEDIKNIAKPIIFFSGAVTEWFNAELVLKIAMCYSNASIVIVGPIRSHHVIKAFTAQKMNNIFLIGEKPHQDLPRYIHFADVCILPGVISKRTLGGNPNTLYEYLACGKPVVTRNFSDEINKLKNVIHVAETESEFVDLVGKALASTPNHDALLAVGRNNDWGIKTHEIMHIIGEYSLSNK